MPRRARRISASGISHVVLKGVNHERIFMSPKDVNVMKRFLKEVFSEEEVEIYAFCFMETHLHIMVRGEQGNIQKALQRVEIMYAIYYNSKHKRNGVLFQNRFFQEPIESERYFWNCFVYIHNNPVKAGVVKKAGDYRNSSFNEFRKKEPFLISPNAIKLFEKRFDGMDKVEEFVIEEEIDHYFLGDEEEIRAQKEECVKKELGKYDVEAFRNRSGALSITKQLKCVAEKCKLPQNFVLRCAKELFGDVNSVNRDGSFS